MNLQRTKRPALRALRKRQMEQVGYRSVDEIADKAKVARNTIYNWEKGFSPALEELDRVAVALEVPLSEMVDAWSGRETQQRAAPDIPERLDGLQASIDRMMPASDVQEMVMAVEGRVLTAIEAGGKELAKELGKQFGQIAAEELRKRLADANHLGTQDSEQGTKGQQTRRSA